MVCGEKIVWHEELDFIGLENAIKQNNEFCLHVLNKSVACRVGHAYVVGFCNADWEEEYFSTRAVAEGEDPEKLLRDSWAEFLEGRPSGDVRGVFTVFEGEAAV